MTTYIVRLVDPSPDGQLHGVVEPVGERPVAFTDDATLLALLRTGARPESDLNPADEGGEVGSGEQEHGEAGTAGAGPGAP
jgi:hypothetical protein